MIGRSNSLIPSICSNHLSGIAKVQRGWDLRWDGQSNLRPGKRTGGRSPPSNMRDTLPDAALPDVLWRAASDLVLELQEGFAR